LTGLEAGCERPSSPVAKLVGAYPGNRQRYRPHVYRGWWIVLAGFLGGFVDSGVSGFSFSTVIRPMATDLDTTVTAVVFSLSIVSITAAAMSFVIGPVADRYGARGLMTFGAVTMGGLLLLVSKIEALWQFYVLFGVGVGLVRPFVSQVVPSAAVASWFRRKRIEAFTLMSLASSVAGVLTPITGFIISAFGWRAVWIVLGLFSLLLVAPLSFFAVRRRPEDVGLRVDDDEEDVAAAPLEPEQVWSRAEVVHTPTFWYLLSGQLLVNAPAISIFIHIVSFSQDYGFDLALSTTLLSVYAMSAILGRPVWAFVAKHFTIREALVMHASAYGLAIGLVIAVALLRPETHLLFPALTLLGVIAGGGQQLRFQAWADYFGRGVMGSVVGYATVGSAAVAAVAPLFLAVVRDRTGSYLPGFAVMMLCCAAAAVLSAFAWPPSHDAPSVATA
jgi:sugar phosphate permease